MSARVKVVFSIDDDTHAEKISALLDALGYDARRVGDEPTPIRDGWLAHADWRTPEQIAARWHGATVEQIGRVLASLDLTNSRAHSERIAGTSRYSPAAVALVDRELRRLGFEARRDERCDLEVDDEGDEDDDEELDT